MKLFIWKRNYKVDYWSGVCVILAKDLEEAKEVFFEYEGDRGYSEKDIAETWEALSSPDEVIDLPDTKQAPRVVVEKPGAG